MVGFVAAICVAFGADDMTTEQVVAVVTAAGVLVAYIFAESYVDASRDDGEKPTDRE